MGLSPESAGRIALDMSEAEHNWKRDQVQHQILSVLGERQRRNPRLCFKGGTLLRSCWADDYRYSEDLDFDWLGPIDDTAKDRALDFMTRLLAQAQRQYRTEFSVRWGAHNMVVDWAEGSTEGVLKVDINTRGCMINLHSDTAEWHLIDRHAGIRSAVPILGYSVEAVASVKIDCIVSPDRAKARDYYDMVRLLESGDVDFITAARRHLERSSRAITVGAGELLAQEMVDNSLENIAYIDDDYDASRQRGLIPDGPDTFSDLFDTWHDLMSAALQLFDASIDDTASMPPDRDQTTMDMAERLSARAAQAASQNPASTSHKCGRPLPRVKGNCDLRRGHPGGCRRLL